MEIDFWAQRWKEGRIGFHEGHPNSFLQRHVERLGSGRRVLVPLCGKTEDLAFLASKGHTVVGIEVVEDAVRAFFDEHELAPDVTSGKHVRSYAAAGITILAGDLFACTKEDVGAVDALYDRAAVVALPAETRPRYVRHLRALLAPASPGLLVTFDYRQEAMGGPPFSVNEAEVRELYHDAKVDLIDAAPTTAPRFLESGVEAVERCFALTT